MTSFVIDFVRPTHLPHILPLIQISQTRRSKISWDVLITSDLLHTYKPHPKMYNTALAALNLKPEECAMVAAHVYDLKAAKEM